MFFNKNLNGQCHQCALCGYCVTCPAVLMLAVTN